MRLRIRVNDSVRCTASLAAPGYLNAHLNLAELPEKAESSRTVQIRGTQIAEAENTSLKWPEIELDIGDTVELRILDDGGSDPPAEVRKSSDDSSSLLSSSGLAKELSRIVSDFNSRLIKTLRKAKKVEPPDEYEKVQDAVGRVIYETGAQLLYPIYRRHQELMPEELKGDLL